ncbi:SdiA-regulated domain-containing protein [Chitinophaga sp. Cy-1792]|uniref:SdiA-regulated domain-containing protein n=1 Tax=Chitinophaga sp. Cy-1792 TaxID=2608339 RepID=UPI00142139BF|nr:SdiA-regulated domain-containing protein [Chitinophaga sp. Cy-1792]NIG51863.1 hypothetical protein [Chitinophaga sp. Cy-1792]
MDRRFLPLLLIFLVSCNYFADREERIFSSPAGYDLASPVRYRVRESMQEISGIVLHPDEHNIIAINDEEGYIYQIDVDATKAYPKWKFGKSGDYEDICRTDSGWFVLKSNGSLYRVHGLFTNDSLTTDHYKLRKRDGKQEFEATYYDKAKNSIFMICKNCEDDKKEGVTSAFQFHLDSMTFDSVPAYQFSAPEIAKLAGADIRFFKPSAAAIHPLEHRLYILASVNQLLVIADLDGHVQEAHNLRHRLFRQPEGIGFADNGDMYISNEGGYDGVANILKFTYHKK